PRTTHRVELSDLGSVLLPEVRAALLAAGAVTQAVDEARSGLRGTIRVGIMQSAAGGVSVASGIGALPARYPGVTIQVRQASSGEQVDAVRSGDLDLAFVGLPDRRLPGVAGTPLASGRMQLPRPG